MAKAMLQQKANPKATGATGKALANGNGVRGKANGKVAHPTMPSPAGEELNPFRIAQSQLDKAAKAMGLDKDMHAYLREPQRFLQVSIPVRMDRGGTKTF